MMLTFFRLPTNNLKNYKKELSSVSKWKWIWDKSVYKNLDGLNLKQLIVSNRY